MRIDRIQHRCEKMVSEPPHYIHRHQCEREGREIVSGKWFCFQHARQAKRRASEPVAAEVIVFPKVRS